MLPDEGSQEHLTEVIKQSSAMVRNNPILKYFRWDHLSPNLQSISKVFADVAQAMNVELEDGPEKSAGLRKLLEAKDCFVRAKLG